VTVPLRAGDCTFHDARTIHMAEANDTDETRLSVIATYMDHRATYSPTGNPYMDDLIEAPGIAPGRPLDGWRFPLLDGSDRLEE
jgi:phytanoyl-CoA hydroxylase